MITQPPPGSPITVTRDGADDVITIPVRPGSAGVASAKVSFIVVVFIWVVILFTQFIIISDPKSSPDDKAMAGLSLIPLSLGGFFLFRVAWTVLRHPATEIIRLRPDGIALQPNLWSFWTNGASESQSQFWTEAAFGRTFRRFKMEHLPTLRLRLLEDRSRITIDVRLERIELGREATDIEREWLYDRIVERYNLSLPARESVPEAKIPLGPKSEVPDFAPQE